MTEWYWILLIVVAGISFLCGRWKGIKDFDNEMVKAGLLPSIAKDKQK